MDLEDELKKFSDQQNLQHRIHHHAKIKVGYKTWICRFLDMTVQIHILVFDLLGSYQYT